MKKIFCVLVLTVFISLSLLAENNSKELLPFEDRFLKVIELLNSKPEFEKKKTKITEKLIKQGENLLKNNEIKKAKKCFDQAIKESEKVYGNYSGFSIFLCLKIANAFSGCEKYRIAAEYMDKVFELQDELCYTLPPEYFLDIISKAFSIYALCFSNKKFNKCMSFADKYISGLTKEDKLKYLSKFYFKLAVQLRYLNRDNEAIKVLQNAIKWTDKKDFKAHRNILINKAFCYSSLNKFKKAQNDLKDALKYTSKFPSVKNDKKISELLSKQILLYIKEAGYLRNKKKFIKAEISLNKAKNILSSINDIDFYRENLANIYLAHGWLCYDQGKYTDAIKFYKKTIEAFGTDFDSKYNQAADTYLHLAGAYQNDKQAEKYYQYALVIANKNPKNKLLQATILYFLGIYYCNNKYYDIGIRNLQAAVKKLEKDKIKFSKKIAKIKNKIEFYKNIQEP